MKGSYILLIKLSEEQKIKVGSLHECCFSCGYYAYVGSAMSGFKSRLNRHLKRNKRPRWHIDYLLQKSSIMDIILCESRENVECNLARGLKFRFDSIPGFGRSDCTCRSHLFFVTEEGKMKLGIIAMLDTLSYPVELIHDLVLEE